MNAFPVKTTVFFGLSSALLTAVLYTAILLWNGEALFYWMTLSFLSAVSFLLTDPRRKRVNALLIMQIILFLYGWFSLLFLDHFSRLALSILVWIFIGFGIFLLYRLNVTGRKEKELKRIHAFYITAGLLVGAVTLFVAFSFWIMEGTSIFLILFLIPFLLWAMLYKIRLSAWEKKKGSQIG
ncbi:hypothetical protein M3221_09355 [Domibacillus indicus]|uniref:hypothetical protein n=1 Tax=Domibacillus indicus TaxID=1437523 RepID=UPI002041793E|nr:hypothetical protein [Domibacillus indicus]MCM3788606.1 hypothetical protein [Domibacillus indicus]